MKYLYNKSILFALLFIFLTSCFGGGIGDKTKKLSGDYYYRVDGSMRYILPDNIFKEGVFPNVETVVFNNEYILVLQTPSEKLIQQFLGENLLSRYTSLVNLPDTTSLDKGEYELFKNALIEDSAFYRKLSRELSPNNSQKDIMKSQEIARSIIDTSYYYQRMINNVSNYWIISHIEDKEYGPYSESEFLEKVKELKIPEDLKKEFEERIEHPVRADL